MMRRKKRKRRKKRRRMDEGERKSGRLREHQMEPFKEKTDFRYTDFIRKHVLQIFL